MDRWEMSTHILSGLLASGLTGSPKSAENLPAGNKRLIARAAVEYADALIDALGEDGGTESGEQES